MPDEIKMEYTRDELLVICETAVVPVDKWRNRDSPSAQEQLGLCRHLLLCGCDFWVIQTGDIATNDRTIWISIEWPSFAKFEYGGGHEDRRFYLPTAKRIKENEGKDWY